MCTQAKLSEQKTKYNFNTQKKIKTAKILIVLLGH